MSAGASYCSRNACNNVVQRWMDFSVQQKGCRDGETVVIRAKGNQ